MNPSAHLTHRDPARLVAYGLIGAFLVLLSACFTPPERTANASTDAVLVGQVQQKLSSDTRLYDRHIDVVARAGVVHLRGIVFSDEEVHFAHQDAASIVGDSHIVDELRISQEPPR